MNKKIFTLITSAFLDILGFSFIFPIIPFIVKSFGGNSFTIGLAISAAAMGMFVGGILFGKLSDHFGRKKILIITTALNILGYLVFGLAGNLTVFFIARFLCGLGGGGASVTQAYLSDISKKEDRTTNMGYMGASIGLGMALGPIFGTFLYSSSLKEIGFISAGILFLSFLNVLFFLPHYEEPRQIGESFDLKETGSNLFALFITFFVITLTFAGSQAVLALFLNDRFGFDTKQIGYTFGFVGIIAIIYQGFLIRYVSRFIKEKGMLLLGISLVGSCFFLLGISHLNLVTLYIILALAVIGIGNANPTIFSFITHFSKSTNLGKNMGLNASFGSMADIVGPIIAGFLYLYSSSAPFYVFGGLLLLNFALLFWFLSYTK